MKSRNIATILLVSMTLCFVSCNSSEQSGDSTLLSSTKSGIVAAEDFNRENAPEDAICKAAQDLTECHHLGCEPIFENDSLNSKVKYLSCTLKPQDDLDSITTDDLSQIDCSNIAPEFKDQNNESRIIICHTMGNEKKLSLSIDCQKIPAYLKKYEQTELKVSLGLCKNEESQNEEKN